MWYAYVIIATVYLFATAWEIHRVEKEKKSKRRAFWMICIGLWVSTVAIYIEGDQGSRDVLTPLNTLLVLLGVLFRDVLYEDSKASQKKESR